MISLLFGLYAADFVPSPTKSYFTNFTKMALVAGLTITYLVTPVAATDSTGFSSSWQGPGVEGYVGGASFVICTGFGGDPRTCGTVAGLSAGAVNAAPRAWEYVKGWF